MVPCFNLKESEPMLFPWLRFDASKGRGFLFQINVGLNFKAHNIRLTVKFSHIWAGLALFIIE